uniref:Uncharacterized protein n=1 Tax=Lepeophtheirus salmonis TaxID=72036 RepID=A0A0K2TKJ0_LEPSM
MCSRATKHDIINPKHAPFLLEGKRCKVIKNVPTSRSSGTRGLCVDERPRTQEWLFEVHEGTQDDRGNEVEDQPQKEATMRKMRLVCLEKPCVGW